MSSQAPHKIRGANFPLFVRFSVVELAVPSHPLAAGR
jgi:hypothetical protein